MECAVCRVQFQPGDISLRVIDAVTEHTRTPMKDLVSSTLQKSLCPTDLICTKCSDLFNEKDRLQKMTVDMDRNIMTKIKDSSKKSPDTTGTISIVMGEIFSNEDIQAELERQYKNISIDSTSAQTAAKSIDEGVAPTEPRRGAPKRRRGRPPKGNRKQKQEDVPEAPPLMVNQREKRKRSGKFNTFLEVLRGEKDFYIEDEELQEPKVAKKSGGRKKKTNFGIVPVEDKSKEMMEKMCIIQVTEVDRREKEVHTADKDKLDLDEVVQEILGISTDPETSLIEDIESLEHDGEDLISAIDEMTSQQGIIETNSRAPIKTEEMAIRRWPNIKAEDIATPSIEVTGFDEDLAASMPSLEVTITQSEDNTLQAVINDPDVLSAIVKEEATEVMDEKIVKSENACDRDEGSDLKKYRCKLCTETFSNKSEARKHALEVHMQSDLGDNDKNSQGSFRCCECDRVFPTARGRDRHMLYMHLKHKPVQCTDCCRSFNSFRPLERHLREFHDKNPTLYCEACEAEFVLGTALEHHKEIMHPVLNKNKLAKSTVNTKLKENVKQHKVVECPICHQKVYGIKSLKLHHQKMHKGQEYTCKYCKYKTNCLSTMHRHMVRIHKALKLELYNCIKCRAGYQYPKDLEEHCISVHKIDPSFLCQHCGEKFACIEMLRFHRKSHRAFSCKLCHLGFMKEEALEEHVKSVHNCDPVGLTENGDVTSQSENESVNEKMDAIDTETESTEKAPAAPNSKVLVIATDGSVQVKEEVKEASTAPPVPSEDVTLHLQQTREGGLEEMDMLNPLKGHKVKDLPKKMNCPVCNKVLTTKFLRTHMLSHKGDLPHKCHVCGKAYAQGTLLRKHMKNRHYDEFLKLGNKNPKKPKIGCDFCHEIYDNIYALEEHLWLHMEVKTLECSDCKIKFGMASNLREHYKSHYFKEARPCPVCKREFKSIGFYNEHVEKCQKRWKCEQCGLECDTQEYYRKHQRAEHGDENVIRYQCNLCEKSFVERHRYDDHMITHSAEKAFTCHICDKQFKRQRPLKDHIVRAHSDEQMMCTYCRKTFSTQQELDQHKKKHKREFPCTACGHVYASKEALTNHLLVHHSETTPHTCHICNQTFVKQANLKAHLITHNPNTPNICHVDGCHKMFRSESLLRTHVARRHHELQYECSVCDRKFGLESDLTRHMATHTTGSSLPCSECGKPFRSEAQLERHLLTHTQEKPYECGICQHTAATRHQLLRHIQIDHEINDATTQLVVNRWRCSVCSKMFVVRGSLLRHLQDHATHGVQAQGHAVKTRSTPSTLPEIPITGSATDAAAATNTFLEQVSTLSWQDLTPLLRLHVMADEEPSDVESAAVAADVWLCPGCLHATQTEEEMRDHLVETQQCQEAVILQLAGGLANAEDLDDDSVAEEHLLNEEGTGAVLQLTSNEEGLQYVIVQEEEGGTTQLNGDTPVVPEVQAEVASDDRNMQVLVSMDDSLHHLLRQPAHGDIQIVVGNTAAPLKQFLTENETDTNTPIPSTSASDPVQDNLSTDAPILNGSEVLLQTADGRLVLQQTVGGVTQYQLVEGVPTGAEEVDANLSLLPSHTPSLSTDFILSD
ncbi:zinc finger protein 91-like [Penaeus chinensis]|uniref:zinc finger protein 91-like n=1 Tax=Penaeus chinensis TaxID=139456 RepID=UPI001FB670BB|nr:zinc finger protein 91-like [Penaeus chinensis]